MIDTILTWFGRIWVTVVIADMLAFYFFGLPSSLTEDWALFHIGWVPIFAVPNPVNILWWVSMVILASPGIAAFILRDWLRARKKSRAA